MKGLPVSLIDKLLHFPFWGSLNRKLIDMSFILLQSRSREGIDMEQPRLQRPNHLAGIVPHHHATPSNISDHSTHSTLSGGSGTGASRDYSSLRTSSRQSPARSPMPGRSAQSPETVRKRAQSPRRAGQGAGSGDFASLHRRGGAPSASSSSSMSESSTSPKMARRYVLCFCLSIKSKAS